MDYDQILMKARAKAALKRQGGAPGHNPAPSPLSPEWQALLAHGGALHTNCGASCGGNPHAGADAAAQAAASAGAAEQRAAICVPTTTGTINCDAPLLQSGSSVAAQSCCVAPNCPPMELKLKSCLPMMLVECEQKQMFIVRSIDQGVLLFDPATCDFASTPQTGCCPLRTSPLLAVHDTSDPTNTSAFLFLVCTAEGIFIWDATSKTFISDPDFPIKDCRDIRCVLVDNSGALPAFNVMKKPVPEDLYVNVTASFCTPE